MQNKKNFSDAAGENVNWYNHFEKGLASSGKVKDMASYGLASPLLYIYIRDRNTNTCASKDMSNQNIHGSVLQKTKARNNLNLHQQNNKSCYIHLIKMNKLQQQARTWVTLTKIKASKRKQKNTYCVLCDSTCIKFWRRAKLNPCA